MENNKVLKTHGGKREGAGKPKGSVNSLTKRRRHISEKMLACGPTPLEVMMKAMHRALAEDDLPAAHGFAKDAAPYIHPRLMAQELKHSGDEDSPIVHEIRRIVVRPGDVEK